MTAHVGLVAWAKPARWVALGIGVALLVVLLAVIATSRLPMRGAEVFGGIANKIKGNPGATAYGTLAGGLLLWAGIGLLAAAQEWWAKRQARKKTLVNGEIS